MEVEREHVRRVGIIMVHLRGNVPNGDKVNRDGNHLYGIDAKGKHSK